MSSESTVPRGVFSVERKKNLKMSTVLKIRKCTFPPIGWYLADVNFILGKSAGGWYFVTKKSIKGRMVVRPVQFRGLAEPSHF